MAQSVGASPCTPEGWGFDPNQDTYGRQPIDVSLCLHSSLSKSNKHIYIYIYIFKLRNYFRKVLILQQNMEEGTEISHVFPGYTRTYPPPLSTSHTRLVCLLQLEPTRTHHNHPSP